MDTLRKKCEGKEQARWKEEIEMGFLESFGTGFLILTIIALVVSSMGFYKYV